MLPCQAHLLSRAILWILLLGLCGPPIGSALGADTKPASSQGTWTTGSPAPTQRSEVAAGVVDGKILVIGGLEIARAGDTATVAVSRAVEQYDPVLDLWAAKAPLPVPLHHAGVAVVDQHLYLVGGFTPGSSSIWSPVATLYRHDPVTDTWTERHPMPTARGALAVAVIDRKVVAIGGYDVSRNTGAVEVYDPVSDTWTTAASLPTPRDHLAAAVVGHDVCAIGGRLDRDYARNLAVHECFRPSTNRWERRADLPAPRSGIAAAALGGRIYVFGGEGPQGTFRRTDGYLPETDRWQTYAEMPTARHGLAAAAVADRIYLLSGGPSPGASFSNLVEIYDPPQADHARSRGGRASATQVGAVMTMLATWSEAGVLPPESTPEANRIIKALIQFQSALMKSTNPHVVRFFEQAFERKFGATAESLLRESRTEGWTSRTLEAVVDFASESGRGEQPELDAGWREFNVGWQDLHLLAGLHAAARKHYQSQAKDIHAVYENKRRLMPGAH